MEKTFEFPENRYYGQVVPYLKELLDQDLAFDEEEFELYHNPGEVSLVLGDGTDIVINNFNHKFNIQVDDNEKTLISNLEKLSIKKSGHGDGTGTGGEVN
jgi:hypothetical protein